MTALVSGCGGGYDVFSGLSLVHGLQQEGKRVVLLNLSFTSEDLLESQKQVARGLFRVDGRVQVRGQAIASAYFPELHLSRELQQPVYALSKDVTTELMVLAYTRLAELEGPLDEIYLCDGGCDVLLTGLEPGGLATPVEDMMHLLAVWTFVTKGPGRLVPTFAYVVALGVDADTGGPARPRVCPGPGRAAVGAS
jgi:hypothetical protein